MSRSVPPLLVLDSLGRCLGGSWIWRDISLQVHPGDGIGVIGPSGAGKSLFLRAVAGLDAVQAGRVSFEGKTLEEWFMPEYRARAVYLHQRPALQEGSVEDNLRSVFEFSVHRHRRYDSDKARSFLERLGRGESFFERDAASLSGGEAQMVALVRALQLDPSLLLLDEPTASLDGDARARIEELILSWRSAAGGRAFLLTSHDGDQVARLCQRHFFLG